MADPFTTLKALWGGVYGTEGAEPYQGGATRAAEPVQIPYPGEAAFTEAGKTYGTQWAPDEVALVQKHFGIDDAKWAKLDHSTQFHLLMEASDKEKALTPYDPALFGQALDTDFPDQPEKVTADYWPSEWDVGQRTPFNIEEAVARHQASVERPSEVVRAYHGTVEGPVVRQVSPEATIYPKFRLPQYQSEKGVFFTPDPGTASQYASAGYKGASPGSKVFPVDLDMQNSVTVDLKKLGVPAEQRWYDSRIVNTAIEAARQNNRDFVVIKGMKDIGGEADQIIAVRPSGKVRSALTGETLFGMLAGLFGVGGPRRKDAQQGTQAQNPVTP